MWSVVAEWLGRRTLNQRVMGSNPGEGTVWYLTEQDTLNPQLGVAIISRIVCGTPNLSKQLSKGAYILYKTGVN
jgi:hypothetical protein